MRVVNPSMTQTPMQQQMPDASGNSFGGVYNPSTGQTLNLIPGVDTIPSGFYGQGMPATPPINPGMKPPIYPSPPNLGVGKPVLGNPKGGISVRGGGVNDAISGGGGMAIRNGGVNDAISGGGGMRNPPALGQLPLGPGQPNSFGLTPNVSQVPPGTGAAYKKGGVVKASPKRKGGTVKSDKPVVRGRGCATKGHGKMRMY